MRAAPDRALSGRVLDRTESPPASRAAPSDEPQSRSTSSPAQRSSPLATASSSSSALRPAESPRAWLANDGGRAGLTNLGNTCFMNAALQCLSHTSDLTDHFLRGEWQRDLNESNVLGSGGTLARAYDALLRKLWLESGSSFSPTEFKRVIARFAPQFAGYQQHDAQELAAFLLDGLHEDLNRVQKKPYVEDVEVSTVGKDGTVTTRKEEHVAAEAWGNYLKRDRSIIVDIFQGQLKSSVRCTQCGFVSAKFDPFMYLTLPLPAAGKGELTLEACLHEFTKEEELDPDNLWRCPVCKDFRKATKTCQLWKLPRNLIVHFKRFRTDARGRRAEKRTDDVRTPLDPIDLRPYLSREAHQRGEPRFELYAVCNHSGSLSFGHYTAAAKHCADGNWYTYNDARCAPCDASRVVSGDNYICFFKQLHDGRRPPRQSLSDPASWPFRLSVIPDQFINGKDDAATPRPAAAPAPAPAPATPTTPKPAAGGLARRTLGDETQIRRQGQAQRGGSEERTPTFELSQSPAQPTTPATPATPVFELSTPSPNGGLYQRGGI